MHSKGNSATSGLQASHDATCAMVACATLADTVKRTVSRSGSSIMIGHCNARHWSHPTGTHSLLKKTSDDLNNSPQTPEYHRNGGKKPSPLRPPTTQPFR